MTAQTIELITIGFGSPILFFFLNWIKESASKTGVKKTLGNIEIELKKIKLDNERLKILQLIQHYSCKKKAICDEYDIYKKMGGNSYIDDIYNEWFAKLKDNV